MNAEILNFFHNPTSRNLETSDKLTVQLLSEDIQ